ncbi:alpha/beta hydrolase [Microbacterium sp. STN6]|uniref:alpha/beta fold hydrolase n=1 Tax=Microbacterium sp. STN6 TaxID=2995588 RepID=UPI0022609F8D|nr:alpha/beta hydrolase [Microbacterium sp. STN6]MCX7521266.1 alpha/beta hydrolase [Microbacterium sp. STN6]
MSTHERSLSSAQAEAAARDARIGDVDWSRLPDGARRLRFVAPSGALAAFSLGDEANPRVVLVPGATGSKEDFLLLAPLLERAGFYVQAFDLAGQYESADAAPADGGRYDADLFTADLEAFLASGPPAHLLGYSFAGIIAQLVTVAHPELVRSLTLLTAPPLTGQAFRRIRWIGWLAPFLSPRVGASLLIWGIVTNKNRVPPGRLRFVRSRFARTRRSSVDDMVGLMMRTPDVRDRLVETGIPLLVAVGMRDLWPISLHSRFARQIGARLAVYRTGHSPCETAPHQLAADMLALFEEAEGGLPAHRQP